LSGLSTFEYIAVVCVLLTAGVGLGYAWWLRKEILEAEQGTPKMMEVAGAIQEGANAYLRRQFTTILGLMVVLFIGLYVSTPDRAVAIGRAIAFVAGACLSALTGFVGMTLAVRGNVRTANAARTGLIPALNLAFRSGTVAGMFTVGTGLLGATLIYMVYGNKATEVLLGFGFGGCLLALFMRVGGGIYTKAADVGADLVGKVEAGIPEDDPRNAAVIADLVGDNVGDCAGMAADIFESYEVTLVASMILGLAAGNPKWIVFPLIVRGIGVLTSILGTQLVRARSEQEHALAPIQRGFFWSAVASAGGFFIFAALYVQDLRLFLATTMGLVLAVGISQITEYYTSTKRQPVQDIAEASQTGTATLIIQGIVTGLESSVVSILCIAGAIAVSMVIFHGEPFTTVLYGISLCGMGMLTTTGVIVAEDTYGPVSDNANGIAEMAGLEGKPREVLDQLDAVGNTTKATTKGFAIATAVVAAISLFGSYLESVLKAATGGTGAEGAAIGAALEKYVINVVEPQVFIGLLIGGAAPFMFSAMLNRAVGRAAFVIINEVRRQFREIKGLMEGKAKPEYGKVVDICTAAALRELVGPGSIAILLPITVGAYFGWQGLGGYLAGIILTGQLMAVFMANAGGAWDNAKKLIEEGAYGGKGSDNHKAAVVGDTVGDPFKDTAGPALNPLIKVMNLVGVLIAPIIVRYYGQPWVFGMGTVFVILIVTAVLYSKRKDIQAGEVQAALGSDSAV
jgi:K(+)-stimulated pyrophosphate-energized sodium pump